MATGNDIYVEPQIGRTALSFGSLYSLQRTLGLLDLKY